jgi:ABC-2 type transport system ATP-binding protein
MSIRVNNITKLYGTQKALDGVSFNINSGEIVGFLGPNGAGKSTMMKILTCYIPQTSGRALVCDFDIAEQSIEVRKNIGYLPENNPLYLDMYVKEYLEFIGGLHKLKNIKSRISEMIEVTGLTLEQKKKIGALSKGYRQRVGLAQALIHDPKVLILDEPTTGLDPNQLGEIRELIKKAGKEKTVIFSTHIMQEVEAVCDRVIIINHGKIIADDETKNIKLSNNQLEIINVEFKGEVSRDLLQEINGVQNVTQVNSSTWQLTAIEGIDIRPEIFQFAVKNNLSVLTLGKEEQKLEDIFKVLTTRNK